MAKIDKVYIEKELISDTLGVRGYADVIIRDTDNLHHVYDIKTINAWSYKMKFGWKYKDENPSIHQELQVATYGLMVEETMGKLGSLYLLYYNKDSSMIKQVVINKDMLLSAYSYWKSIRKGHERGLPVLGKGISPTYDWECNYCNYKTQCKKDEESGNG